MKLLVSAFSNLANDQRIEKICRTIHESGMAVELVGNNWNGAPPITRNFPVHRLKIHSKTLKLAYPEFNVKLFRTLMKSITPDTVLYCNDLDALTANYLASKLKRIPLIFDSHEIYTEMPSLQKRFTKKIWEALQRKIIPEIKYFITASDSYADWFVKQYDVKRPVVVRNFPLKNVETQNVPVKKRKIIMYQGALNPARGLEKMIAAMPRFHNTEFWIAGAGPQRPNLEKLVTEKQLGNKVKFLGNLPPEQLRKITPIADVGLSIEENLGTSYYLSLPNKIADYIQARVPVVVSCFPEMQKIIDTYGVGVTIDNHTEEELFHKINSVIDLGKDHYKMMLEAAAKELCWENEAPKLLSVVHLAVSENF